MERPTYLAQYDDPEYFEGQSAVSSYANYEDCKPILVMWSDMVDQGLRPTSVLDVGAAYGYVVDWFQKIGVFAVGIEPSAHARDKAVVPLFDGFLPDIEMVGDAGPVKFDAVLCTEVLEHIPESDIGASLRALAGASKRVLVLLIMLEDHPTAHDDAGHVTLRSREWWDAQLNEVGVCHEREAWFNEHPYAEHMGWAGRIFVRQIPQGERNSA
jgi:SAM-dependent methyltransferase